MDIMSTEGRLQGRGSNGLTTKAVMDLFPH